MEPGRTTGQFHNQTAQRMDPDVSHPRPTGLTPVHRPASRVRVAHVSFFRDPDGRPPEALLEAWPTLTRVAQAARGAGVEIRVFQACGEDQRLVRGNVTFDFVRSCWGMPLPARRRLSMSASRLVQAVCRYAPDVVHVQGLCFPAFTRLLARRSGAAVFLQDHAGRVPPRVSHPWYRWALALTDGVGFTSREQAQPLVTAGLLPHTARVYEVLESSTDFTPGDREAARTATGIHGDPAVVWVGRLAAVKDPLTVLAGFRAAARRLPDAHLWCWYTDAPLLDAVRRMISRDEVLRTRVHLQGTAPHGAIERILRAGDVFVSGSRREGSGYAVIEALACGLPVVVPDIPAFRRLTRDGAAGTLYPPGESDRLADILVRRHGTPRPDRRARAREHFERFLSFDVVGEELRAAYRGVVEARCESR